MKRSPYGLPAQTKSDDDPPNQAFGLRIIVIILPSSDGGFSMIACSSTASIIRSIKRRPISG